MLRALKPLRRLGRAFHLIISGENPSERICVETNNIVNHPVGSRPMPTIGTAFKCAAGNGRICRSCSSPDVAGYYFVLQRLWNDSADPLPNESWDSAIWSKEDLPRLPVGPDYQRTGANTWHNPGWPDPNDSNHWGTPGAVSGLQRLASSWMGSLNGCQTHYPLKYNDMSLELGGKYDLSTFWTGSHKAHKLGRHVDIRSNRGGHTQGVAIEEEKLFCQAARNAGFATVCLETPPGSLSNPYPGTPCTPRSECASVDVASNIHWHLGYPN